MKKTALKTIVFKSAVALLFLYFLSSVIFFFFIVNVTFEIPFSTDERLEYLVSQLSSDTSTIRCWEKNGYRYFDYYFLGQSSLTLLKQLDERHIGGGGTYLNHIDDFNTAESIYDDFIIRLESVNIDDKRLKQVLDNCLVDSWHVGAGYSDGAYMTAMYDPKTKLILGRFTLYD